MATQPKSTVKLFANPHPDRNYTIHMDCPEFTSVCPITAQPDFGRILIEYVPDRQCIELKSLKLYLWSFRDQGVFYEDVVNRILKHLAALAKPRWIRVTGRFNVRGGIATEVTSSFRSKGFRLPAD